MASNALTTAGRFGSSQATEPAARGQRFQQIVVSAIRGPVQLGRLGVLKRHLYGNNHRCLYEPPGNVTLVKGAGSRYGGRPPRLIAAQLSEQGAV